MIKARPVVLLVDEAESSLAPMLMILEKEFDCLLAREAEEAMRLLDENEVQILFCATSTNRDGGIGLLDSVREKWPEVQRVVVACSADTSNLMPSLDAAGITQLVTSPWHPDLVLIMARSAAQKYALEQGKNLLSRRIDRLEGSAPSEPRERPCRQSEDTAFAKVPRAPDSPMNDVISQAKKIASFDIPVLIVGEIGTGKNTLARAMHHESLRVDQAFHEINCAGVDDDVLMAQLFGARQSQGAAAQRFGAVRKADRGTLFLNNIHELSPNLQGLVLRLVKDRMYREPQRLEESKSNARIIASCDLDLEAMQRRGGFRSDLFYELSRVHLNIPALRERPGDITIIAESLLFDLALRLEKPVQGLSRECARFLKNYRWPGNIRELRNELTQMLIFSKASILGAEHISKRILLSSPSMTTRDGSIDTLLLGNGTLKERVDEVEGRILRETLTRLKWNKSQAAAELGISRVGLRAKIQRLNIEPYEELPMVDARSA